MRIVVCGDSVSTTFGVPEGTACRAFPHLLTELVAGRGDSVTALVSGGAMVTATCARLEEILHLRPDVVVLAHGVRESMLRYPKPLKRFPVHPDKQVEPDQPWVVRRVKMVRRSAFKVFLALAGKPRVGDRAIGLLGVRPFLPATEFDTALQTVVRTLRQGEVLVVLVQPSFWRRTDFAWSTGALLACRHSLLKQGEHPGVTVVDPGPQLQPRHFAADGVHLSPEGHERMAGLILQAVDQSDVSDERVPRLGSTGSPDRAQLTEDP